MGDNLEQLIGALNGALGDYLHRTRNGLATTMHFVRDGRPMALTPPGLAAAYPDTSPRIVVLVHGLMSTEIVFRMPDGSDYGSLLARDLGYTPFYLRYNSGLHISENGEALDGLLEALVLAYGRPIDEICLVGHSMGGLVIRSAFHAASGRARRFLPLVKRAIYVGTPHLGAPLERFGNAVAWALARLPSPYTRLAADLVNLRSSGVKDLRYANLRSEDWEGADADALLQNRRHPVPLLPSIRHYLIAGTLAPDPFVTLLFGDALVPVESAAGRARAHHKSALFPQERVRVLPSLDHVSLAHYAEVYAIIRSYCEEEVPCNAGAA
jgi:pimeloyl-ACP methyl ester carboxylesterase